MTFGVKSSTLHCIHTAGQLTLSDTKWYFTQAIHKTKCTSFMYKTQIVTYSLLLIHNILEVPSFTSNTLTQFMNSIKNSNLDATARDGRNFNPVSRSSSLTVREWILQRRSFKYPHRKKSGGRKDRLSTGRWMSPKREITWSKRLRNTFALRPAECAASPSCWKVHQVLATAEAGSCAES